jgi:hypothetical protein
VVEIKGKIMNIIFGRKNAEKLREKYTVLDLETVIKDGNSMEVFCLIPADKMSLPDLPQIEGWIKLHNDFLAGYHNKHYEFCKQCVEHLMGKFGGELDTFYEEIIRRINEEHEVAQTD